MAESEREKNIVCSRSFRDIVSVSSLWSVLPWTGVSPAKLAALERKILSNLKQAPCSEFVRVGVDRYVWTLKINTLVAHGNATPIVLLHGMGAGAALWLLNLDTLASHRSVYVLDMLGFGRSSRPMFSDDPVLAEMEMVESLEAWRKEVGLDKFILLGHCFGGFLATSYTIRYPDRIRHLILVEPWGFSAYDESTRPQIPMPMWVRLILLTAAPFNPFAALRLAGSWGPALVTRFKPDLIRNYSGLFTDDTIAQYIHQWNAVNAPTGEAAFKHMTRDFGWALYPMIHRIKDIPSSVSITTIFGSRSWVDSALGQQLKDARPESYVDIEIIRGAGHFVFADKADLFNQVVTKACTLVDHRLDVMRPMTRDKRRRRLKSESAPNLLETFDVAKFNARRLGMMHRNSECLREVSESECDESDLTDVVTMGAAYKIPKFDVSDDE